MIKDIEQKLQKNGYKLLSQEVSGAFRKIKVMDEFKAQAWIFIPLHATPYAIELRIVAAFQSKRPVSLEKVNQINEEKSGFKLFKGGQSENVLFAEASYIAFSENEFDRNFINNLNYFSHLLDSTTELRGLKRYLDKTLVKVSENKMNVVVH